MVTAKWTAVLDKDLAGYEIRYIEFDEDAAVTWEGAVATGPEGLINGTFSGTTFTTTEAKTGTWVFMIKAIDTSGNYSLNAMSQQFTVNAIYQILYNERAWPLWKGTLTGCVRDPMTGFVYPESQDVPIPDNNNWIDYYCYNPVAESIYTTPEIDLGAVYGARTFTTIYKTKPGWEGEFTGVPQKEAHTNIPLAYIDYKVTSPVDDSFDPIVDPITGSISLSIGDTRYIKFQLVVTNSGGLIKLLDFAPVVDTSEAI